MSHPSQNPQPLFDRYLSLVDRYAGFATGAGKKIRRASRTEAGRLFEKAGESRQRALVSRLEVENAVFAEMTAAGERPTDSRRLLWRHFGKSGFTPRPDIFGKIEETDIVEVYGLDQIHLFQNLNFFDWISHTLEQIFCETWYELSRRDAAIEKSLGEIVRRILLGESRETITPDLPWHIIQEVNSTELNRFDYRLKHLSPVTSSGQLCCIVAVSEARSC